MVLNCACAGALGSEQQKDSIILRQLVWYTHARDDWSMNQSDHYFQNSSVLNIFTRPSSLLTVGLAEGLGHETSKKRERTRLLVSVHASS